MAPEGLSFFRENEWGSDPITKFLRCSVVLQEEVVQVDDLGDGGGDAVEDLLFEGDAVGVERGFVAVLEEDDELLFEFDAEVVVGDRERVAFLLHVDERGDVVHREDLLHEDEEDRVGDLVGVVLLLQWSVDVAFLYVVADHRGGDRNVQRGKAFVDILDGLLEVESHIRELIVAWHPEISGW